MSMSFLKACLPEKSWGFSHVRLHLIAILMVCQDENLTILGYAGHSLSSNIFEKTRVDERSFSHFIILYCS